MSGITIEYRQPPAAMADHLSFFYQMRQTAQSFEMVDRADFAQFRFILRGRNGRYRFSHGVEQAMPDIYIQGPTTGAVTVSGEGEVDRVGVGLMPAGWAALVPMNASAASNRLFDACDLFGDCLIEAQTALRATDDFDARVAILLALVVRLTGEHRTGYHDFVAHVNDWLADAPFPDVAALV